MKRVRILSLLPSYICILTILLLGVILGNKAITTLSQSRPIKRHFCVIIDAGHGGVDGGATSCTGILESELNLEIAKIADDLFHFLGYQTKMIRAENKSVYKTGNTIASQKVSDIRERVRTVNETSGGILLSIHQNHFSDPRYKGAQVFWGRSDGSMELAKQLQRSIAKYLDPTNHRVSKPSKGVYLMEHIQRPGILIECGFISNPEEEARLKNSCYQKKFCSVLAESVIQYIDWLKDLS